MKKIKLAIWGITDAIWDSIMDTLDPRKTEIIFFIDNNEKLEGTMFELRPVYAFRKGTLKKLESVDYILIAAYSGFQQIERKLIVSGCAQSKIQLYITERIREYNLGNLFNIDKNLINAMYFEPERRWNEVVKYQALYEKYEKMNAIKEDDTRWYNKGPLIAHACGGFVNGRKLEYSNSKEALDYSFAEKFRLIECDVLGIEQGEIVLAHNFNRFYESLREGYTIQNISDMLISLKKHPEVHMLVDVKWKKIEEYNYYVSKIVKSIYDISKDAEEAEKLKAQIVMEVYEEASIQCAKNQGFDVFFTQYRNDNVRDFLQTIIICLRYNIGAVGFSRGNITAYRKAIPLFKEKNIKIFVFSSDSIKEYKELKKIGVDGIFTNYLKYEDIQ